MPGTRPLTQEMKSPRRHGSQWPQWPPNQPMCMHHELSYRLDFPGLMQFACLSAPTQGGATGVADAAAVLDALPGPLVERLEREGRMTDAGRAVIERAKADGSWSLLDDVENLVVPDDLAAALAERPPARDHFDAFPRGVRRSILEWIAQAKRPETRSRRVEETATLASRNERANQWVPKNQR